MTETTSACRAECSSHLPKDDQRRHDMIAVLVDKSRVVSRLEDGDIDVREVIWAAELLERKRRVARWRGAGE